MIRSYKYDDCTQISEHFNANEFACECHNIHDNLISDELIEKLEEIFKAIGASKGIITSGYRCPDCDIAVGGNGCGQHTKGTAADIIFYDNNGQPISSKIVCCKAQDLNFGGIANITDSYTYTHLDVRTSNFYRGNEINGTDNVTSDFYEYFGINRNSDNAISDLQRILNAKGYNLAVDGIAGPQTISACRNYTIENGDCGPLTKWVQSRLNSIGFDCGTADGIAGKKTMSAIGAFQKQKGLGQGYLGGTDWDKIIK